MTKEEKIKEAWGESNLVVDLADGWSECIIKVDTFDDDFFDTKCEYSKDGQLYAKIRPKSLQGIENNNGWIKIESEEDLPKEVIECRTCFYNGKNYIEGVIKKRSPQELSRLKYINEITHYQPIEKPKPPIY